MRPLPKIHIVGAGIGGLTLARCLKNKDIQAVIFEKNPFPARHNYGISLQPRTYKALLEILKMEESTFCQRVAVDGVIGGKGQVYPKKYSASKGLESPFRAHRGRLGGVLRESLDIHWGHALEDVSSSGTEHVLNFKEKGQIQGTLLVDTSGVHSPSRKSLLPGSQLNILPYVVFRGTRHVAVPIFKELYEPRFEDGNVLELRKGDVLLQISMDDVRENEGIDISYIYSRPAHEDDRLHRPDRYLRQAADISKLFFAEGFKLNGLEQPFDAAFDGEKMKRDRILHWLMRNILLPLGGLKNLAERGILLMGDVAHATPILGGQGTHSTIADAVELAEWISSRGVEKLGEFHENRYAEWGLEVKESEERLAGMHSGSKHSL
ncbi:FAD/NAD(P)-binding domain-containing protein [Stipitochalara longipes BDJ]|nr:FAD/NAD(P)-binding domain-containing protein [Stipitochalara longipes BDJ]